MTTRTLTHPNPGPVTLNLATRHTDIRVEVADVPNATVTLSTDATRGAIHDLVQSATASHGAGTMTLDLSESDTGSGMTVISGGGNVISVGNASGSIVVNGGGRGVSIINGRVWIDGKEVTGDNAGGDSGTLTLTATVPAGSSLTARSSSGEIRTIGPLVTVHATTSSGDVKVERAREAFLGASSGSVRVRHAERVQANTSSGSIRVEYAGEVTASASSGSIKVEHVTGPATLTASSGSVDVCYSGPEPAVMTSSGSKRVRNINPFAGMGRRPEGADTRKKEN